MASLDQWRAAGQHPQLQAAESVLHPIWVCPRPVEMEDVEAAESFTEARVFAIHFAGAPGDPVDSVLACVPATALVNHAYALAIVAADCYGSGGTFLFESLGESVPATSSMLAFSDLVQGASPCPPVWGPRLVEFHRAAHRVSPWCHCSPGTWRGHETGLAAERSHRWRQQVVRI
eukprot:2897075-Amphidinium_carterae.1